MVLAAGSRRYSWGPEVANDNEDGDSEPWPSRHTSVHVLFFIVVSFFFPSFFFSCTNNRTEERKKKLILVIAIQISLRASHPPPSSPPFSSRFSLRLFRFLEKNFCSRSFLYNSVAFYFLLPLTIRGSLWSRSYLFPSRKNSTLSRLLSFSLPSFLPSPFH